ncbi:MAG: phage tail protein I [Kiritimatiellales bacterium]
MTVQRAETSILPGAPAIGAVRKPRGIHAMDITASRIAYIPHDFSTLWNPDTCRAELLPWLAWAWSVDAWDDDLTEAEKRALISNSIYTHRKKGTVASIRAILKAAGYETAKIIEGRPEQLHNGIYFRDGTIRRSGGGHWAYYSIDIGNLPAIPAGVLTAIIDAAPKRCILWKIIGDNGYEYAA